VDRRTKEVLKALALKGIIVGFSEKRIYVSNERNRIRAAAALKALGLSDMYREEDVAVIGEVFALDSAPASNPPFRTARVRPVMMGVSCGHRDTTAGTLGGFASKDGEHYVVSNAHVLHPYPLMQKQPHNLGVWQPGPHDAEYDYANEELYRIADYTHHVRIRSVYDYSSCPVTKALDSVYVALGRRSRVRVIQEPNYVDLGIARLLGGVDFVNNTFAYLKEGNEKLDARRARFVGNLFAGTSLGHAVVCKTVKYWRRYYPEYELMFENTVEEVEENDRVAKDGRTSGATEGTVWDAKCSVAVGYWLDVAWFEDVVLTYEDIRAQGGDSGSPVFLVET